MLQLFFTKLIEMQIKMENGLNGGLIAVSAISTVFGCFSENWLYGSMRGLQQSVNEISARY